MRMGKAIDSASGDRSSGIHVPFVILHFFLPGGVAKKARSGQDNHSTVRIRAGRIECLVNTAHRGTTAPRGSGLVVPAVAGDSGCFFYPAAVEALHESAIGEIVSEER